MNEALWEILEPSAYAIGGLLISLSALIAIFDGLIGSLRVSRGKLFSRRAMREMQSMLNP